MRASASAAARASCEGTIPKSVTTPARVSTWMSSAGVRLSASKRIFVAEVIHRSRAAAPRPSAALGCCGVGSRQISASARVSGLWISLATRWTPGTLATSATACR